MMLTFFGLSAFDIDTFTLSSAYRPKVLALFRHSAFDIDTFAPSSAGLSTGTFSAQSF
jgi:hypothetical protein